MKYGKESILKSKIIFLFILTTILIFTLIPSGFLNADPATPSTNLNLYLGAGIPSDSYVKFGQYNGSAIIWRVLRQDNGTDGVFLLSDKILILNSTYNVPADSNWENSDIRSMLNGSFLNGFNDTDKGCINPFLTTGTTVDKIFLPTTDNMYADPFKPHENNPDPANNDTKRIAYYVNAEKYWTRSNTTSEAVPVVDKNGSPTIGWNTTNYYGLGTRPMLYLLPGLFFSGSGTIEDPYIVIAPVTSGTTTPVWVRTMPMTCSRVWVNEDGNFQFLFWYPYRDNNWVRIYDASGKLVFETDMPYDNPNLTVSLPDGIYTVKTFHDHPEPLQTFTIGK